jgi:type IV pilus assembly protein PilC
MIGISTKEITRFTGQLATLLDARMPLLRSLEILSKDNKNKEFKSLVKKVISKIKEGVPFSETLKKYPKQFSQFYINMVKIGEETGKMPELLHRINQYLTQNEILKQKFIQAMLYPFVVVFISIAAVVFLLIYVVPEFETMFANNKAELPAITKYVLYMSHFLGAYGVYLFLGVLASFGFGAYYLDTKQGYKMGSKLVLQLPLFGDFLKKVFVARICMILSVLIEARVSLLNALSIAKDSIRNDVVSKEIQKMVTFTSRGDRLTDSLAKSKLFPEMITQMLTVGEETAKIDLMLKSVADYYSEEVSRTTDRLAIIIEPVILVVLGLIVGTIVISIYLPMFELGNLM